MITKKSLPSQQSTNRKWVGYGIHNLGAAPKNYDPWRSLEMTKTCHRHSFRALNSLNICDCMEHRSTCPLLPVISMTVVSIFIVAWSAALVDWFRRSDLSGRALTPITSAVASLFCIMLSLSYTWVLKYAIWAVSNKMNLIECCALGKGKLAGSDSNHFCCTGPSSCTVSLESKVLMICNIEELAKIPLRLPINAKIPLRLPILDIHEPQLWIGWD